MCPTSSRLLPTPLRERWQKALLQESKSLRFLEIFPRLLVIPFVSFCGHSVYKNSRIMFARFSYLQKQVVFCTAVDVIL